MKFLIVCIVVLTVMPCVTGCSRWTNETVGVRLFIIEDWFHNDDIWASVVDPSDDSMIVAKLMPGSDWSPAEVHRLPKDRPIVLRLHYLGASETDVYRTHKTHDTLLDMNQNYDLRVSWLPRMAKPSEEDEDDPEFDWIPHWARTPSVEVESGHQPIF